MKSSGVPAIFFHTEHLDLSTDRCTSQNLLERVAIAPPAGEFFFLLNGMMSIYFMLCLILRF